MERNKASCPDGLPAEFFLDSWEIIKDALVGLFDDLFSGRLDLSRINFGIITLIS
jgi:hypothetical protein